MVPEPKNSVVDPVPVVNPDPNPNLNSNGSICFAGAKSNLFRFGSGTFGLQKKKNMHIMISHSEIFKKFNI